MDLGVRRVAVAPRGEHLAEHAEAGRHHQHAGPGADQHQSSAATRVLEGQLLGQAAAPGDAEGVEPVVAEPVEQRPDEPCQQSRSCRAPSARGEPPTPGTSNRTTSIRGSTSSTNGWSRSRLAPMPLQSTSGGPGAVPGRTATRTSWPRTRTRRNLVTCRRRRCRAPPRARSGGATRAPWAPDAARRSVRRATRRGRSTRCPGGRRSP